ncbi:macrolide ABC transporter ATP-binding protein [candidate division WWE3 bacterium RIFOXYD1_FULL_39_9]|uniref:Macrolide ABC transporter ATP-binding protein n=1 Tax=candidate division WWE3 bacterium RIFOXYD1_FULL_39_9 TaxID=1802649 RepID=A0A1F4X624_UNCKA|nr:MAG: macrolide ABC transporter ATP-binding protein [candidate division WWE3 bacterium RIFOXYD1_FULL_39_9]
MEPLLKGIDIVKEYDLGDVKIQALKGVSLEVFKGEFLAIVGKSGSGKSTLMHILGLLDTPTSGQLILNGTDVSKHKEKELARIRNSEIGFVFQSFNLLPRTTTLDNVILPLKYSKVPKNEWKAKATDMLKLVDLGDRLHNKSNELSGGQKQRVAIARALVNEPSIIFADEPTGNLDSRTGQEIIDLFLQLHEQGKTIILVTHDSDLAKIAKRQVVIKDGLIVEA